MTMRSILAFLLGAVVAAAVVYYSVRPKSSADEAPPQQTVQTVKEAEQPGDSNKAASAEESSDGKQQPKVAERTIETRPSPVGPVRHPVKATQSASTTKPASPAAVTQTPQPAATEAPKETAQSTSTPSPAPAPASASSGTSMPAMPPPPPDEHKPEPRKPATVTIPAGTLLNVRIDQGLSSERNESGDSFKATLDAPLIVDGMAIAERGSRVQGRIVEVDRGGKVSGLAKMSLELTSVSTADGQRLRIQTEAFARQAEKDTKKDAMKIGAAAGIGAAIGAIAGGGKGAAIGAAAGGAAGTGGVMMTRGKPAEIAAETRLAFRLAQPVTVTEKLN